MADRDPFYERVGELIRKRRNELKIPQDTLASDVGLTRTSISNIEKGRQKLLLHTFFEIARTLKSEPAALLPQLAGVPVAPPKKDLPQEVRQFIESAGIAFAKKR